MENAVVSLAHVTEIDRRRSGHTMKLASVWELFEYMTQAVYL